jgi:N-acetylmuramoyl-L-alanine amidase
MRATGFVSVVGLIAVSAAFSTKARPAQSVETVVAAQPAPAPTVPIEPEPPRAPTRVIRVALQAGHWKAMEAPDELAGLRDNGTSFNGKAEWEVNLEIANKTADALRELGYEVDVLPATVPPRYKADLFISIHADGNNNSAVSGYRVAGPGASSGSRRGGRNRVNPNIPAVSAAELTQRAEKSKAFADLLTSTYGKATGIPLVPTLTRRMQNYYAFNSRRYQHALDPSTTAVIIETGFLTSPQDRRIIVADQQRSVRGIVDAVTQFEPIIVVPPIPAPEPRAAPRPAPLTPGR